jgi:energy-coupling factor transporter ATP-binding protein EcfA2
MTDVALGNLSPYDFELLTQDLLTREWGDRFEGFTVGRDGGIDLRILKPGGVGNHTVVQCKHYAGSGYKSLLSAVKREAPKAATLKAKRYVLVTSVPMTAGRKHELGQALRAHQVSIVDNDVFGAEDVQFLLRRYEDVQKTHFKLWLNSTAVLERLLNGDIFSRTEGWLEELKEKAALFVPNESVQQAQRLLSEEHVCLISGPPGVGKTTLADILFMIYAAEGYQPVVISEDVSEADRLYAADRRQIFLFDDFLGRTTTFDRLGKNEDDRLLRLIRRVKRSSNKRFLLTTREYILQQARFEYERLEDAELDLSKLVLNVGTYTRRHKALILYNHIYFSDANESVREAVRDSGVYKKLVRHRNYNPRLISDAIRLGLKGGVQASDFPNHLLETFDHPKGLWGHVFRRQFSATCRAFLALTAVMDTPAPLSILERAHARLMLHLGTHESFVESMRVLEGTALHISRFVGGGALVHLENPGVEDAVLGELLPDPLIFRVVLEIAPNFDHLLRLWLYGREPSRELVGSKYLREQPSTGRSSTRKSRRSILSLGVPEEDRLRPDLSRQLLDNAETLVLRLGLLAGDEVGEAETIEQLHLLLSVAEDLLLEVLPPECLRRFVLLASPEGKRVYSCAPIKSAVVDLMGAVARARLTFPGLTELASGWVDRFYESLDTPDDYELLLELNRMIGRLPTSSEAPLRQIDRESLRLSFLEMIDHGVDSWPIGEYSDDLGATLMAAQRVAVSLQLNDRAWSVAREILTSRLEDAREQEDHNDYDRDYDGDFSSNYASGEADEPWLDDLFDTLA